MQTISIVTPEKENQTVSENLVDIREIKVDKDLPREANCGIRPTDQRSVLFQMRKIYCTSDFCRRRSHT